MRVQDGQRGLTRREEFKKSQEELKILAENLSNSSKQLCRHLDNAPNEEKNLKKVHDEKNTIIAWLSELSQEIVDSQSYNILTQHAEERRKQSELLSELKKKEREKALELRMTEAALKAAQSDYDKSAQEDEIAIQSLMSELKVLKAEASMRIALETKKYKAHEATLATILEQRERELETRVLLLEEENARLKNNLDSTKKVIVKQTHEIIQALNNHPLRDFELKQTI